jgi:hypothetical protein
MSLPEEIENYRRTCIALHRKVPSGISERWVSRVIERNLHSLKEKGADIYLELYGRGISEGKVVNLAIKAEIEGCKEMADVFWKKAFSIQSGESETAKRIRNKRRQLMILEEQKAQYGFGSTPAHIIIQIEDLRRELEAYGADDTT